jgi:hypothetical protein
MVNIKLKLWSEAAECATNVLEVDSDNVKVKTK